MDGPLRPSMVFSPPFIAHIPDLLLWPTVPVVFISFSH